MIKGGADPETLRREIAGLEKRLQGAKAALRRKVGSGEFDGEGGDGDEEGLQAMLWELTIPRIPFPKEDTSEPHD